MTIAQYLRLLRAQWVLVAALTVLGTIGAGLYTLLATPTYQATTQLFVSTSGPGTDLSGLVQGGTFIQQRVKSYTDLVTSPRVLQPVIDTLRLDATPAALAEQITASSPLDTVLIDVTVTDPSPQRASDIATAVAAAFPALVNELETPSGQTFSPVKVSITRTAKPPATPVAPRTTLNLALGLLVGLGAGLGAAVLRDTLDRTVGDRHRPADLTGAPVLGTIVDDPQIAAGPLAVLDPLSPQGEAFRQLRTNIRFLSVDHRVTSLVVTGSVEAEGKTTTATNLAVALAHAGEDVVLIDADLRRPRVADLFGLSSGLGLTSVLVGDTPVGTALQQWRHDLPFRVLTAGPTPPNPSELLGSARMTELVHQLTAAGSIVVIDAPPLLPVTDAAILARLADGALLVTRHGSTTVEQLTGAVETLHTAGATLLGLVLNRVPRRAASSYGRYDRGYAASSPRPTPTAAPAPLPPPLAVHLQQPAPADHPWPLAAATQPSGRRHTP